jgi:electron transfer flavoprotein beta subunit
MNILVLVKQIPDQEAHVGIAGDGRRLDVEQKFCASLFDEIALEEALRIREKHGGKVKVVTLGGEKGTEVLRSSIAMGADEALLLDDNMFQGGDGYTTALALSKAASLEAFDIILCGKQGMDEDRGEVGPMVAQFLELPHVGGIVRLDVDDGKATAESAVEGGREIVEVDLPAVFTAERGLNDPRTAPITGVMKAMRATIAKATPGSLGLTAEQLGVAGAKTRIEKYMSPPKRPDVRLIAGEAAEAAAEAVRILIDIEKVV